MHSHSEVKELPYSAEQLFDLVMDIEKYPEFLPWCKSSKISKKTDEYLEADLVVGYKFFREEFTSRVYFERPNKIHIEYIKGAMNSLKNDWQFADIEEGKCRVSFNVEFSLKSILLEMVIKQFFDIALKRMATAFEARAKEIIVL